MILKWREMGWWEVRNVKKKAQSASFFKQEKNVLSRKRAACCWRKDTQMIETKENH